VPPLLAHHVPNFQDVDSRALPCPKSDNRHRRVTKDIKIWYLGSDTVDDPPSGGDDGLGRLVVTAVVTNRGQPVRRGRPQSHLLLAHVLHSSPSSSNERTGSTRRGQARPTCSSRRLTGNRKG